MHGRSFRLLRDPLDGLRVDFTRLMHRISSRTMPKAALSRTMLANSQGSADVRPRCSSSEDG